MGGALLRFVAPIGGRQVPVPLAHSTLATKRRLEVVLVDVPGRGVPGRVTVRPGGDGVGDGRQTEVLPLLGLASRVGGKGVEAEAVVDRQLGVVAQGQQVGLGRTVAAIGGLARQAIGLLIGVAVGAGLVVIVLAARIQGQLHDAAVADFEALVEALLHGLFLAVVAKARVGHRGTAGVGLEDHVDHPGNGVRPVLGSRTIAQHFDMVDGADGDQVQVSRRRAGVDAVDIQGGTGVAALAVDQHQHFGGAQTPQVRCPGNAAGVPTGFFRQGQRRDHRAQRLHQPGLAGVLQLPGADHVNRHRAAGDRALLGATVAGHDDRRQGAVILGLGCCGEQRQGQGSSRLQNLLHIHSQLFPNRKVGQACAWRDVAGSQRGDAAWARCGASEGFAVATYVELPSNDSAAAG